MKFIIASLETYKCRYEVDADNEEEAKEAFLEGEGLEIRSPEFIRFDEIDSVSIEVN